MDSLLRFLEDNAITGWFAAIVSAAFIIIKNFPTWFNIAVETRSTTTATVITSLLEDKKQMSAVIDTLQDRLEKLQVQHQEALVMNLELRNEVNKLEQSIKVMREQLGDISGEHEQS